MHAGEIRRIDHILGGGIDNGLLVGLDRIGFLRGDEAGADVGEIRPHGLRRQDGLAIGDRTGQRDRAVVELADFTDQREGAEGSGMAASPGTDQDQAVDTGLQRLFGMAHADHVVEDLAAVGMHVRHDLGRCRQAGNDQRHLMLHTQRHVVLQPLVGRVDDLIDGERRGIRVGCQLALDAGQPFVEQFLGPGIERREGTNDAALALGNDQIGVGNDEHRRADHRQREVLVQGIRNGHYASSFNARRRILPTLVRGKSSRNSTCLGTL